MTKTQAKRRLKEINSKMFRLYESGYVTLKEVEAVAKIVKYRTNNINR
tara:strand:- start:324 stop:467 length:144 start_codon:yes stop_codon:yes gene_type:complete